MQHIPNLVISDLHKLDEKILNGINALANATNQAAAGATNAPPAPATGSKSSKIDKNKKDLFKKVTSHLIGRNIGQLFKKEVVIRDLPRPPATKHYQAHTNLLEQTGDTGIGKLFNT